MADDLDCDFTGIAQHRDLFVRGLQRGWAGGCLVGESRTVGFPLILEKLFQITGMTFANGIVTEQDEFAGPRSCIVVQGLGFDAADLLVTEGGIFGIDPNSNFGNR